MNNPREMHIIETEIVACEALLLSIPSPFAQNTIIHACVQLCPEENNQFRAEYWGDLPDRLPNVPPRRILLAQGYIPYPDTKALTYHNFMNGLTKSITEQPFFNQGTKLLLELHREHMYSQDDD